MAGNKGKPSGFVAETKVGPGAHSRIREKPSTPGAGKRPNYEPEFHPAGVGGPEQNAGGPEHHGANADEDHNP
ncbi:hypothetical protein Cflav_PD1755 [Pedosphaera parvula Ellin514]|uniref:Uncharacterized protein n=1 Tax=Pedosphaera parvula (strain Ellin514) TaxID=320771 RepID=B9XNM5_PEDPL|nr:hypothetical protein Cflav_PD1755 [Pedosphaera parvula Ellin514]